VADVVGKEGSFAGHRAAHRTLALFAAGFLASPAII
jgi:hypothetical protein